MDESWRMRMGMPSSTTTTKTTLPRRRSTEDTSLRRKTIPDHHLLETEDFTDVFGGPPRTVLSRQFSGGEFSTTSFYQGIFLHQSGEVSSRVRTGRNLPEFRIPVDGGRRRVDDEDGRGFYNDVFGWDVDGDQEEVKGRSRLRTRSGSKSKGSSSSALSSEDLSPLRPTIGDMAADDVAYFAAKLRPINVPSRWPSTGRMNEEISSEQGRPAFPLNHPSFSFENGKKESSRSSHLGFSRRNSSPETISLDPNSYCSMKVSLDDLDVNSSSSAVSSVCHDQAARTSKADDESFQEKVMMEQDEDEVMSSYVIEINIDGKEGRDEAIGVDEAIAWAKEKFQTHCSENSSGTTQLEKESSSNSDDNVDVCESTQTLAEEGDKWSSAGENQHLPNNMELDLLDEKIRIWSNGKEADIRLLLSTLHYILWINSGWLAVGLTELIESSQVKKAYQKARLCLHPDKLQQRGATLPQKYVAEKAFSILQDAWAAFLSQDVFL